MPFRSRGLDPEPFLPDGAALEDAIARLLAAAGTAYRHATYAARIERA